MKKSIKALSKHKQIFLITHNPNLVVNLDPENIIIPEYRKESDKPLIFRNGSMESNIEWKGNKKNMIDIIADEVEGGREALDKRLIKYELGGIQKNDY